MLKGKKGKLSWDIEKSCPIYRHLAMPNPTRKYTKMAKRLQAEIIQAGHHCLNK